MAAYKTSVQVVDCLTIYIIIKSISFLAYIIWQSYTILLFRDTGLGRTPTRKKIKRILCCVPIPSPLCYGPPLTSPRWSVNCKSKPKRLFRMSTTLLSVHICLVFRNMNNPLVRRLHDDAFVVCPCQIGTLKPYRSGYVSNHDSSPLPLFRPTEKKELCDHI